jgi:hypothetical protein
MRSNTRRRGGASIGQPISFFGRGGFFPSLMGGVLQNGPYLMGAALSQGARLIMNNKKRMATRKRKTTHRR